MATLSGFTIQDTYQSLVKISDNASLSGRTGSNVVQLSDGLGARIPFSISQNYVKFRDEIDFVDASRVSFSGLTDVDFRSSSVDFNGANVSFDDTTKVSFTGATEVDFANAYVNFESTTTSNGILRNVAVYKDSGRQTALDGQISFSGGTGINVEEDTGTNIFTFSTTGEDTNVLKIGTGTTTTPERLYYWDGTDWVSNPTSSNAYDKLIGFSLGTNSLTDGMKITGLVNFTGYDAGALYLGTSSTLSSSPDYTDGNAQRGVGHSVGSAGVFLNPDIYYQLNIGTSFITTNDDEVLITNDGFALAYE